MRPLLTHNPEGLFSHANWQGKIFTRRPLYKVASKESESTNKEIRIWPLINFRALKCDFGSNISFLLTELLQGFAIALFQMRKLDFGQ
jgi:hypothetical protein